MEILEHVKSWILLLLFSGFSAIAQEDSFYSALDFFLENPSQQNLIALENTRDLLETPDDASLLARVIVDSNLGYYKNQLGNIQGAIVSYENAANVYAGYKLEGYDIVSYVLIPLGNLYTKTNALSEAERVIRGYISLSRKQKHTQNLLTGLINLSIPLQNQGKYNSAIAVLKEALKIAPDNIDAQMNLATSYVSTGNYAEAQVVCKKVISQDKNQLNAYKLLAQIALQKKFPEEAITYVSKSIDIQEARVNKDSRTLGKTYLALAETYITQQKYSLVQAHIDKTLSIFIPTYSSINLLDTSQLYPENTLLDALDLQAVLFTQENKIDKALEIYEKAAHVSDLINTPQLQPSSRIQLQRTDKERSELRLALLYERYKETGSNLYFEKAAAISDRSKARILIETSLTNRSLRPFQENKNVQAYTQSKRRLNTIENQLLNARMSSDATIAFIESLQEDYAKEVIKLREIQRQIDIGFPNLITQSNAIELKKLTSKTIKADETVVSYFFGDEHVYMFSIKGEAYNWERLAASRSERDALFQLCVRFNGYFDNASVISNDPQLFILDAFNLQKALQLPSHKNLTIIPDGMLSFIPFNTLLSDIPDDSNFATMPFILKTSIITYNTSLATYQELSKSTKRDQTVLGIFPVFEGTELELAHSITESEGISKYFDTTLLLKEEAVVENAFAKANDHPILHFSTHAIGGTFTTPAELSFYDQFIYVSELNSLQLDAELVVLSACETGVGRIVSGEGVFSLARGFQQAGAENVLFSLWKVNDESTATMMSSFYQNLKNTKSKSYSIHQAQLDYLENLDIANTQKTPYHWASFVYYGNSEIPETAFDLKWIIALSLLSVFLVILLFRKYGITS